MEWIKVQSSNLRRLAHEVLPEPRVPGDDPGILMVEFLNGAVYAYEGVPKEIFEAMCAEASPGSFLNKEIKPRHRYRLVLGPWKQAGE